MDEYFQNLTFQHFRRTFYLVTPNETTFETLESTPDYLQEASPVFVILIALELLYSIYKKKNWYRPSDTFTSLFSGVLQQTFRILFCGFDFTLCCWLYEHYAIIHLPWNSVWTWILAFILCDLSYYWFHRMAHEINIFWAFHQMHHSSEDFNLSTAIRQGMFQPFLAMLFNLPQAFILPPTVHLVHLGLNKVNQFWVHTQSIKSMGPLEHILVSPSHHRVHHGRNRYCIDKNYGGTFIIWDKLFGTFQAEKEEEPVAFGLVHNVNTFDGVYCQLFHFKNIFCEKVPMMNTIGDKIKAVFYGPGWYPGTGRMGSLGDIPDIESPIQKYDTDSGLWTYAFVLSQLNFANYFYFILYRQRDEFTFFEALKYFAIVFVTVKAMSTFLENNSNAWRWEILRGTISYFWFIQVLWPPQNMLVLPSSIICCISFTVSLYKTFFNSSKTNRHFN